MRRNFPRSGVNSPGNNYNMGMRVIGDVHGLYQNYLDLIANRRHSVQVGDFGFDYKVLEGLDPNNHKIIGGNHDNYDAIVNCPNYLGDYGTAVVGGVKFFFVRGENSIDAHLRIEGSTWWRNEELTMEQGYAAVEAYSQAKPDIVISHGCPAGVISSFITNSLKATPSRTSQILDAMWSAHRPSWWIFGHHHNTKKIMVENCEFKCLNELETIDI